MSNDLLFLSKHDRGAIEALTEDFSSQFGFKIIQMKLFGSKTRNEDSPDSDIDIMVVVTDEEWELKHAMWTRGARLSLDCDVLFNLHIVSKNRWRLMEQSRYPLYRLIMKDGIDIQLDSISVD